MIHTMSGKIIVTNLRIKEEVWLQIKAYASELGISANEYLNLLAKREVSKASFKKTTIKRNARKQNIFDALLAISKKPNKPMGASQEDKIIYGIK